MGSSFRDINNFLKEIQKIIMYFKQKRIKPTSDIYGNLSMNRGYFEKPGSFLFRFLFWKS